MSDSSEHTPLHDIHIELGARMVPYAGWAMPLSYRGITLEHQAVRERAGLFDVSHMGRFEVRGPGALKAVDHLVTNSIEAALDGRATYTCCCRPDGGILDDLIVYRRGPESVWVVCNASNRDKIVGHFQRGLGGGLPLSDLQPDTFLLALQGPRAWDILAAVKGDWARSLPRMGFADGQLAGIPVTVAKTGYTGEVGVEILGPKTRAVELYRALQSEGSRLGLEPIGLGARDTLRLEARLSLYGHEIDESIHPFEAGLGWTVKLEAGTFVGQDALREHKRRGWPRTLVGLEMIGRGIARAGYPVLDGANRPVGHITSGGPSPTLGKNIALAYVPMEHSSVDHELAVDCRGKPVTAKVTTTPFYKRAGSE